MSAPPDVEALRQDREYLEYRESEQRRALFGVLATTLVRQLRGAGYADRDLIGFVSTLVQRISEEEAAAREPEAPPSSAPASPVEMDENGRPRINDGRVLLRAPDPEDSGRLQSWIRDPVIQASLAPELLDQVVRTLGSPPVADRLDLLVCDPVSGVPFGLVSLGEIDTDRGQAEIAKLIGDPAYRRRGLARAATEHVLRYGFHHLGLHRIYLRTLGGNLTNIRLNERMGFRFEGVLREAHVVDGERRDIVLMALLRTEFDEMTREGGPRRP